MLSAGVAIRHQPTKGEHVKASLVTIILAAVLAMSGCAELSKLSGKSSDVPIEELGAVPIEERGAAGTGGGTATTGQSGPSADVRRLGAGAGAAGTGPGGATAGGLAGATVETHALPGIGVASVGGTAAAGSGAQAGTGKGGPTVDPSFKDPDNPLSKRVIYFDYDSSAIREEFRPVVEAHASYLKGDATMRIILQGHTDQRGSRDYNLALGQRRSESVRQAMSLLGVPDEQMEAVSLGEEKPVAEGDDESAWRLNRRTEIHYLGE